jgi:hypothetical protein
MSPSGRRLATNKAPKLSKLKGRLSSEAESGTATHTQMLSLEDSAIRIAVFPAAQKRNARY